MANGGNQQPRRMSEEEYKKRLISDITPIQRKEEAERQTSGDFVVDSPADDDGEIEESAGIDSGQTTEEPTGDNKNKAKNIQRLESESEGDFRQRQMNAGQIPKNDAQARQQENMSAVPGGKSDQSPKAQRDRELKRLKETTYNLDTGKHRRNGSALKIATTDLRNRYQNLQEKFSLERMKERVKQRLKKFAFDAIKQVAKKAAIAAWGWIAANIVPILIAIIGIVIIVFAIVILIRAWQTPNSGGSSPVQAADIITDRPWFSRVLLLAGDREIAQKLTDELLAGLETNLAELENDMKNPPYSSYSADQKTKIADQIKKLRELIGKFKTLQVISTERKTIADQIVSALSELLKLFSPAPFYYIENPDLKTAYPVNPKEIRGYTNTLHCETYIRPASDCGRHRTFHQFKRDTADAVDIFAPAGTAVYAAFSGKVVGKGSSNGQYLKIEGKDAEGKTFLAVYAHINTSLNKNSEVRAGDQIGTLYSLRISRPHLHFELYSNERAVVTLQEDVIDRNGKDPKHSSIGKYLYIRMLNVLRLPLY